MVFPVTRTFHLPPTHVSHCGVKRVYRVDLRLVSLKSNYVMIFRMCIQRNCFVCCNQGNRAFLSNLRLQSFIGVQSHARFFIFVSFFFLVVFFFNFVDRHWKREVSMLFLAEQFLLRSFWEFLPDFRTLLQLREHVFYKRHASTFLFLVQRPRSIAERLNI